MGKKATHAEVISLTILMHINAIFGVSIDNFQSNYKF